MTRSNRLTIISAVAVVFLLYPSAGWPQEPSPESVIDSRTGAELRQPETVEVDQEHSQAPSPDKGEIPDFLGETSRGALNASDALQSDIFSRVIGQWLRRLVLNQGGALWLGLIVTMLVAFDFRHLIATRNLDLLLFLLLGLLLVDLIRFAAVMDDPTKLGLARIVFAAIYLTTAVYLVRALVGGLRGPLGPWKSNLSQPVLAGLLIVLVLLTSFLALVRHPDDAGVYTNIGAHKMLQTGKFPYTDPELAGGSAATYGPLMYLAHMPFQLVIGVGSPGRSGDEPPKLATKLAVLLFHYLGVAALLLIGRRYGGVSIGLALACLYVGSPYVLGLGGEELFITGMTYMSHIAPAAVTLLAFSQIHRPLVAGGILAAAAGVLFYPIFLFPLWFGYLLWRRDPWLKFTLGFLVVLAAILVLVLLLSHSSADQGALAGIYESTIGHQEARDTYGASNFSFWGTHPELARFWQWPLVEGLYLFRPSFLLFLLFLVGTFFWSRRRSIPQLAFLTAAVVLAIQLWKSHAPGTYVEWYYPFLLTGLLCQADPRRTVKSLAETELPD